MDLDEKEKIKQSFLKVKEDIESLKTQLNELKRFIEEVLKKQNFRKDSDLVENLSKEVPQEISSTGNQGVYTNKHSFIHSHMHSFNKHSTDIQTHKQTDMQTTTQTDAQINSHLAKQTLQFPKEWSSSNLKDIDSLFLTLTKGEFLCFLTIFQLEEDLNRGVSYLELSRHLSLSEGCIRTYVSQMLKKAVPLQKIRLNNKLTLLTIDKSFRSLNLKSRLVNLFSQSDPNQTTLT